MNEKACPVCGKYFIDRSRGGSKDTCSNSCRWEFSKNTPQRELEALLRIRFTVFKAKGIIFTLEEAQTIRDKLVAGVCDVCGASATFRNLHIDHDHDTNKFRGVLCNNCNHLLGNAKDNTDILSKAILYLHAFG